MQKKRKIKKTDDLKNSVRIKTEEKHQARFQLRLQKPIDLPDVDAAFFQLRVKKNGSFKISQKVDDLKTVLRSGEKILLLAGIEESEKAINIVEILKAAGSISNENVKIEMNTAGEIKIYIQ